MALIDQPYLPLYVDDWMNNNKLKMCSPAAHGLMISIMCIMHKEKVYGKILLKQKFKQSEKQSENFANQIARLSSFSLPEICSPFDELISEGVLEIDGDYLVCNRMVKDAELSQIRAKAGKKGAQKKKDFADEFAKAKGKANTVNGIVNEIVSEKEKGGVGEKTFQPLEGNVDLMGFKGQCRVWMEQEHKYIWAPEDDDAIDNLHFKIKRLNQIENKPTQVDDLVRVFKKIILNLPDWVRENKFSLAYINSKFNEIKSGGNSKHRDGNPARISKHRITIKEAGGFGKL